MSRQPTLFRTLLIHLDTISPGNGGWFYFGMKYPVHPPLIPTCMAYSHERRDSWARTESAMVYFPRSSLVLLSFDSLDNVYMFYYV